MQGGDIPRNRRIETEERDGLVAGPIMGSVGTRCVNNGGIIENKWHSGTDSNSKQTNFGSANQSLSAKEKEVHYSLRSHNDCLFDIHSCSSKKG